MVDVKEEKIQNYLLNRSPITGFWSITLEKSRTPSVLEGSFTDKARALKAIREYDPKGNVKDAT